MTKTTAEERKQHAEQFKCFAYVSGVLAIIESGKDKPTLEQANDAIQAYLTMCGFKTEEELLATEYAELIANYTEIKNKILSAVPQE